MSRTAILLGWTLTALGIAYIGAEFAFNSAVLDIGVGSTRESDLEEITRIGRLLAAGGVTLAILRVFFVRWRGRGAPPGRFAKPALIIAAVTLPTVYFGEKQLIEYIVDRTNPGDRLTAQYLLLTKIALQRDALVIESMPKPGPEADPSARTFYAVMGPLFLHEPALVESIRDKRQSILERVAKGPVREKADLRYADYRDAAVDLRDAYNRYQEGAAKARKVLQISDERASSEWAKLYANAAERAWDRLKRAKRSFHRRVRQSATVIHRKMTEIDERGRYRRCVYWEATGSSRRNSTRCTRVREEYESKARQHLDNPPPIHYWCDIDHSEERILSWNRVECDLGVSEQTRRLRPIARKEFIRQSGGFTPQTTKTEFMTHPDTLPRIEEKLAERLRSEDFDVPHNFSADRTDSIIEQIAERIRAQARARYNSRVKEQLGTTLPMDLSWSEFVRHPAIREREPTELAVAFGDSVDWSMDRRAFEDRIVVPTLDRELERYTHYIDRAIIHDPDQAKPAVYVTIVPAIVLAVSLFVALFNAGMIVVGAVKTGLARLGCTAGWMGPTLSAGFIALLLAGPFFYPSSRSDHPAVQDLVQRVGDHAHPVVAFGLDWTLRLEPPVYRVGRWLRGCETSGGCPGIGTTPQRTDDNGGDSAGLTASRIGPPDRRVALWLQDRLNALGYNAPRSGVIDLDTIEAIRAFQADHPKAESEAYVSGELLLSLRRTPAADS